MRDSRIHCKYILHAQPSDPEQHGYLVKLTVTALIAILTLTLTLAKTKAS